MSESFLFIYFSGLKCGGIIVHLNIAHTLKFGLTIPTRKIELNFFVVRHAPNDKFLSIKFYF